MGLMTINKLLGRFLPRTAKVRYCSSLGPKGEALSKQQYWKCFYNEKNLADKNGFDWLLNSEIVSDSVLSQLATVQGNTILDLGCGMSSLSQKLLTKSQHPVYIHNVDYIQKVIEYQKRFNFAVSMGHMSSGIDGVVADVCLLPYRNNIFDVVVDKGTMDIILKEDIKERRINMSSCLLQESLRILRPGGCFMQFTDEDPDIHYDLLFSIIQKLSPQYHLSFTIAGCEPYQCFVYLIKKT
ncbi:citrate synthase-lysine N-methyltransferase CSKMT, mitochondrial-like [Argonauta hians]